MVESTDELNSALRLLAIVDDSLIDATGLTAAGVAAARAGATSLQLRSKSLDTRSLIAVARSLASSVDVPVFVNDRIDVAVVSGARGVHLGSDDVPVQDARRIPAASAMWIGSSVGLDREVPLARGADYWGAGPCFGTGTKSDAGAPLGPAGFARLRAKAPDGVPVIGIGGINPTNCGSIIDAGADGVAVVGSIFGSGDIEAATRALRQAVEEAITLRDHRFRAD